jgi:hypothetical protein
MLAEPQAVEMCLDSANRLIGTAFAYLFHGKEQNLPETADGEGNAKGVRSQQEALMAQFAQYALSVTARDAAFLALAAATLSVSFSFSAPLALVIGAHIAFIFSTVLLYRVTILAEERLRQAELSCGQKPYGELDLAKKRDGREKILLRFSKSAAAIACTLLVLAVGTSLGCGDDGCFYTGM